MRGLVSLSLSLGIALLARDTEPDGGATPSWSEGSSGVTVSEGPAVLHADVFTQWGGHTFAYLLEGPERLYWAGLEAYEGPALVGAFPKPGSGGEPVIARVPLEGEFRRTNPPQIVRTGDEHLHVFLCTRSADDESGDVHYWRTSRPGDVRSLVDRSSLLPRTTFSKFTVRQNVGLSRDGERIVFCNLTDFAPGEHLMNTPLVWIGRRDGEDFRFSEPVVYGEQTAFFYPQVAATDEGPVLLGSVDRDPNRNAELVHLDWEGNVLLWEAFPAIEGESWAFDMQPLRSDDWSRLAIARTKHPFEGYLRAIEFWSYDTKRRELTRHSSYEADHAEERSFASAGKFWMRDDAAPLFLNEPGSSQVVAWSGDFLTGGDARLDPLPRTRVSDFGYPGIRSLFFPSLLHGSIADARGLRPVAVDVSRPGIDREVDGDRCAFLLWWLRAE